jgi:hypothetical protein
VIGTTQNEMDSVLLNFPKFFKSYYCLNNDVGVVVKSTIMATADPLKTPMSSFATAAFPRGKYASRHCNSKYY